MKKAGILCALALIALGVCWYIVTDGTMNLDAAKQNLIREAQEAVAAKSAPEEVAILALKTIHLTQGEKGAELWRLKADWGNMRRTDNIVEVEKPTFTYYMSPNNAEVRITARKGELDQAKETISFAGSVEAALEDKKLVSALAVYYGKAREMVFPQGAQISDSGLKGRANRVVWRLHNKVIVANGNVDMTFENVDGIFDSHDVGAKVPPPVRKAGRTQG